MTKPGDPTKPSGDDRDRTITRLEKALGEALTRIEAAESSLDDQRQRLKALGLGREETMRTLTETRDELRRISQERDELRKQLARVRQFTLQLLALVHERCDAGRQFLDRALKFSRRLFDGSQLLIDAFARHTAGNRFQPPHAGRYARVGQAGD
jgi:septal ring factor EnvC (AmiA/AmiB activator)